MVLILSWMVDDGAGMDGVEICDEWLDLPSTALEHMVRCWDWYLQEVKAGTAFRW